MTILLELLSDGYFPKELPSPFNTRSFAALAVSQQGTLPGHFLSGSFRRGKPTANAARHSISRVGTFQRLLRIPNPIPHFRLCSEIDQNWATLSAFAQQSKLSVSTPVPDSSHARAIIPETPQRALSEVRTSRHIGGRYFLKADLSKCYHSIYTHSFSWALHGKTTAKMDHSPRLLGNRLDTHVRDGQEGQTIGIPVGPDTSLILAEIILTAVDEVLVSTLGGVDGFRYVDDYEFSFSTRSQAERALNALQSVLADFELELNASKTGVSDRPVSLNAAWAIELSRFQFKSSPVAQSHDLINYFSRAFELAETNSGKSVIRYAVARFRFTSIDPANVQLLQTLLLNCVSREPGSISFVLEQLVRLDQAGYSAPITHLEKVLNAHIQYHAPIGPTSEVAWALWGSLVFGISLHDLTAAAVCNIEDSIVALLALDADSRRMFLAPLNKANWQKYMTPDALYEDHWLLSYEANVKGWMNNATGLDHVAQDTSFGFLKTNGVEFYDIALTTGPTIPPATLPFPGPSLTSPV
jgi:hypothetical protein